MIKKIPPFLCLLLITNYLQSQVLTVSPGSDLVIIKNTTFAVDSLVLTPSADFTLSNLTLSRSTTITHAANNPYISRVYSFSNNTNPFTGSIQISYRDGAELNGLSENTLQLNAHNGVSWQAYNSTTNDNLNNFVLTNSLSGIVLNELTLAETGFALPLQWRLFTAAKQAENVLLKWSTFAEHNTSYFTVQTSTNGTSWNSLTNVTARGNSTTETNYNYLHTTPSAGYNYYRIMATDIDGRVNYTVVQKVFFEPASMHVEILGNPVTNGMLSIKVTLANTNDKPAALKIYTSDGKLLRSEQVVTETHSINVSGYAKGSYLLQVNNKTIKFLIK